jgi:hypothetical protein
MAEINLYCRNELKQSVYGEIFCGLPQFLRRFERKLLERVTNKEKGVFYSYSLRRFLDDRYKVILGSYSYADIDDLLRFPINTGIGRYPSIGPGVKAFAANHPMSFLSMHPFFRGLFLALQIQKK